MRAMMSAMRAQRRPSRRGPSASTSAAPSTSSARWSSPSPPRSCSRRRSRSATASRSWPFLVAGAATLAFGAGLEHVTEGRRPDRAARGLPRRRAALAAVAVFGALPYVLAEPQLSTTRWTRCSSRCPGSRRPAPASSPTSTRCRARWLMWRQFTTWIGGVGIIVLFLAVLPRLRVGGRQALFRTEAPGPELGARGRRSARPRAASSCSTSRSRRSRSSCSPRSAGPASTPG